MKYYLGALAILLLVGITSCDRCKDVDCLNDGVCENGECLCLPDYEGEQCQFVKLQFFHGRYDGTCFCDDLSRETNAFRLSASEDGQGLLATDDFGLQLLLEVNETSDSLSIVSVTGSRGNVADGGGILYNEGWLSLVYTVYNEEEIDYQCDFFGQKE